MFPNIEISGTLVEIKFNLVNQIFNAKPGGIKFEAEQIESIDTGSHIFKEIRGLRAPGTFAFVFIAGTYWRSLKIREFWNARKKFAANTIRINLKDHFYSSVVFQVANPAELKKTLENLKVKN